MNVAVLFERRDGISTVYNSSFKPFALSYINDRNTAASGLDQVSRSIVPKQQHQRQTAIQYQIRAWHLAGLRLLLHFSIG